MAFYGDKGINIDLSSGRIMGRDMVLYSNLGLVAAMAPSDEAIQQT